MRHWIIWKTIRYYYFCFLLQDIISVNLNLFRQLVAFFYISTSCRLRQWFRSRKVSRILDLWNILHNSSVRLLTRWLNHYCCQASLYSKMRILRFFLASPKRALKSFNANEIQIRKKLSISAKVPKRSLLFNQLEDII